AQPHRAAAAPGRRASGVETDLVLAGRRRRGGGGGDRGRRRRRRGDPIEADLPDAGVPMSRGLVIACVAAALAGACTAPSSPCDDQPHACVNTTVDTNVASLDQLVFRVDQPKVERLTY